MNPHEALTCTLAHYAAARGPSWMSVGCVRACNLTKRRLVPALTAGLASALQDAKAKVSDVSLPSPSLPSLPNLPSPSLPNLPTPSLPSLPTPSLPSISLPSRPEGSTSILQQRLSNLQMPSSDSLSAPSLPKLQDLQLPALPKIQDLQLPSLPSVDVDLSKAAASFHFELPQVQAPSVTLPSDAAGLLQAVAGLAASAWSGLTSPFAIFGPDRWLLNILFVFTTTFLGLSLLIKAPKQ